MTSFALNQARSHERACIAATQRHIDGCVVCRSRGEHWVGSLPVCDVRHACEAEIRVAIRRRVTEAFHAEAQTVADQGAKHTSRKGV